MAAGINAPQAQQEFLQHANYLGDRDPTARRMLETIPAQEEEHAEDLASVPARMA